MVALGEALTSSCGVVAVVEVRLVLLVVKALPEVLGFPSCSWASQPLLPSEILPLSLKLVWAFLFSPSLCVSSLYPDSPF